PQTGFARYWTRTKWLLLGLFAPELVAYIAWQQRQEASKLYREVRAMYSHRELPTLISRLKRCFQCRKQEGATDDPAARFRPWAELQADGTRSDWRLVQSFFVIMGGFCLRVGSHEYKNLREPAKNKTFLPNGIRRVSLTSDGFKFLLRHSHQSVPNISTSQIWDKSKADRLKKTLVCAQAIWFCTQCITRLVQSLPVSLLELNTFGHALCTLVIYFFWWDKPLDIDQPILINCGQPILAYMWMSSKVSVQDYCSADMPYGLQDEFHSIWPFEKPVLNDMDNFEVTCWVYHRETQRWPKLRPPYYRPENTMEPTDLEPRGLELSDPRPMSMNPDDFQPGAPWQLRERLSIFGRESRVDDEETRKKRSLSFMFRLKRQIHSFIYPSQAVYRIPPGLGSRKTAISHFSHADSIRWCLCVDAISEHDLEEDLRSRHDIATSGRFFNSLCGIHFPYLDALQGSPLKPRVELRSRNAIPSLATSGILPGFAIAGALYGALHLVAWSAPFPSPLEELLWRIAATSVTCTGFVFALLVVIVKTEYCKQSLSDLIDLFARKPLVCCDQVEKIDVYIGVIALGLGSCIILLCVLASSILYLASRGFLVVESLRNVAFLPPASFKTPVWSTYFPHIT
ncbi:MAG: hypothetical protein L6R38_009271, partial [Xanthoria sp. 2 TBL-2021]